MGVRVPERSSFADAALALAHATEPESDLCGPFVAALGVSGAAVSTLGDPLGSETVGASTPHNPSAGERKEGEMTMCVCVPPPHL